MVFWNTVASSYIAQNPPTAQNWVIGGNGIIIDEAIFGQQELANFDAHETRVDFDRADNPDSSLYVAQRNQADAESAFQEREYLLGDFDLGEFDGLGSADEVFVDPQWQTEVAANAGGLLLNNSDESESGQIVPFSFDYALGENEHVYAAVLSLGLRGTGGNTTDDMIWVESAGNRISLASLGLTQSLSIDETSVLTIEVLGTDLEMLADGIFNLAVSGDSVLDWANLEILAGQGTSQIVDADSASNQVFENATFGATVGLVAQAFDADATDSVSYELIDNAGGRFAINSLTGVVTVAGSIDFESNTSHSITVEALSSDGSFRTENFDIAVLDVADGTVTSRSLFYRGSSFDNSGTLNAVATDKSPLFDGSAATFENYSSYTLGINGVVLEVNDLTTVPTISSVENFFEFKVGNNNDPDTWITAPTPIDLVYAEGVGATDQLFLIWEDNAIQGQWLQTKFLSNSTTGLPVADTFYFGNAIGETGNSPNDAIVNLSDVGSTRINQTGFGSASIENVYDFNRDGRVNLADVSIVRTNQSGFTPIPLIDLTSFETASAKTGNDGFAYKSLVSGELSQIELTAFQLNTFGQSEFGLTNFELAEETKFFQNEHPQLVSSRDASLTLSLHGTTDTQTADPILSDSDAGGLGHLEQDSLAPFLDSLFENDLNFVDEI